MGQAELDLGIDILLNLRPSFRVSGRVCGDQGAQVSGGDIWKNSSLGKGVEVIED